MVDWGSGPSELLTLNALRVLHAPPSNSLWHSLLLGASPEANLEVAPPRCGPLSDHVEQRDEPDRHELADRRSEPEGK